MDATTPRTVSTAFYSYLKIAEGCSNCCAYCVIPRSGALPEPAMADVIAEAERLAAEGTRSSS